MDAVSCLYNFLSIGILCYFVIICFLIKKCCMNCGTNCASDDSNLCKCYQKIYEGEITPSNHVIVREGNEMLPISYLINQQQENESEYVLGEDGVLYRNEACKECCLGDDISRSSCNSHEDVFVIRASRKGECSPCSPSALGLGEGSFKRTASGRSVPTGPAVSKGFSAGPSTVNASSLPGAVIKGSPQNISDISELKGLVNYGQPPAAKRASQSIGSVGSSQASQNYAKISTTSSGTRGNRGSPGSPPSRTSRGSCGSPTSNKSDASGGSKKSCISSCPSAKTSKSSPTVSSGAVAKKGSATSKGSPTSKTGSACSDLGKPCPSSGSPSQTQSMKSGLKADEASLYGPSVPGSEAGTVKPDGASLQGPDDADESYQSNISGGPTCGISPTCGTVKPGLHGSGTKEANKSSKSFSCVSPCGTLGARTIKKQTRSYSFSLPCGSPGVPCPHKTAKSTPTSPRKAEKSASSPATQKEKYGRGAGPSSNRNRNVCDGAGGQTPITPHSKSGAASPYSTGVTTPASSPSSPNQKSAFKCTRAVCGSKSGQLNKNAVEKTPSPILKNPEDSPSSPKDGVVSPRVSIKENLDIITPQGITSAPTFGKDECKPCPFLVDSEVTNAEGETASCSSNRRNDIFSDEYKDNKSNKRKADKISADYKDSADNSRGTKTARFSDRCNSTTCSSRVSSSKSCSKCSKANKSWASSSTPMSSAVTPNFSTTKCSKCSSDTRVSSITSTSTKTKPSGSNSLCETTCKTKSAANSSYLNSPNAKSNFPSVTTADIDDFRDINPNRSRCENLGSALARSSCGEIRKAREAATCEAIKDPSKNVICNTGGNDPNSECSAIRNLMKDPNCPSILQIIQTVDEMSGVKNAATSASTLSSQNRRPGTRPGSASRTESGSRPGTSSTVDAVVIHEISTKVQSCLQHARAIAAKMGSGTATSVGCRKTMRVQASSRGGEPQSVKVNSNIMLNTKGITINEYNKVDKPFGKNPGIQVKMRNADGNVEQFKKSYAELMTANGGPINIRIRSPCRTTPGKLLCVSTTKNPCCSDSTMNNTTTSTQPTSSSQGGQPGNKVTYEETSEDDDGGQPSSQEYSSQESKNAVVMYKRPVKGKSSNQNESSTKGECSPDCTNCKKKSCPTSKYYKGRKKQGKLQVYNVTTSHFSQINHNFRSPYVKGMPIIDSRMYEQYIHPERYRAGETYLKRRREMIQKIKGKCPWM